MHRQAQADTLKKQTHQTTYPMLKQYFSPYLGRRTGVLFDGFRILIFYLNQENSIGMIKLDFSATH